MEILEYNDHIHRIQLIQLWSDIFNYTDKRNNPALVIDKKLAVKDGLLFAAVNNEKVVGSIMAGYDGHRGWIYSLAVDPEYRKQKTGSLLLDHAEKSLTARGCMKINLQILGNNNIVKEFYLKNGYSIENRISMGKRIPENE